MENSSVAQLSPACLKVFIQIPPGTVDFPRIAKLDFPRIREVPQAYTQIDPRLGGGVECVWVVKIHKTLSEPTNIKTILCQG